MAKNILTVILIAAACFIVYANSTGGKFVWDDDYIVKFNAYIRDFSHLKQIFTQDQGIGSGRVFGFYRPVQLVTYAVDFRLWRLNEFGYHLTNILIHALAAIMVWLLALRLSGKRALGAVASLLFAVHPAFTSAISYISGRADPLFLSSMLAAFIFYLKILEKDDARFYAAMLACYAISLLSKEHALIFPVLLLAYHLSFVKRVALKPFLSTVLLAAVYIVIRFTVLKSTIPPMEPLWSFTDRLAAFFAALGTYARIMVLPVSLHAQYGNRFFAFFSPQALFGIAVFIASVIAALRARKSHPLVFFSILWFYVSLFPVSNLIPINAYMAEHWLYLPFVGVAMIAGSYATDKRFGWRGMAAAVAVILVFSSLTVTQNRYWRDPENFFKQTLKFDPDNANALNDLARVYESQGRRTEAIPLYKKSILLNPSLPIPYNNLGVAYMNMGDFDRAIRYCARAVDIFPGYADALSNIGVIFEINGRFDEAADFYGRALQSNPNAPSVWYNLGNASFRAGNLEKAAESYKKAIALDPGIADPRYNLGVALEAQGKPDEAIESYKAALLADPLHTLSCMALARSYAFKGDMRTAADYYNKAMTLGFPPDQQLAELINAG